MKGKNCPCAHSEMDFGFLFLEEEKGEAKANKNAFGKLKTTSEKARRTFRFEIVHLWKDGQSVSQIAKKLGSTRATVWRWIERLVTC